MSRLGKKVIAIPEKTEVTLTDGVLVVKGSQGTLQRVFRPEITITLGTQEITLKPIKETLETRALWGGYGSIIASMLAGVNKPFEKKLILDGIGYKSEVKAGKNGSELVMALGFSHPVNVEIPKTLKVIAEKNVIVVSGVDKEEVGRFAANLRAMKKPEPYKGKGFHYDGEIIKRKQGKKAA